MEEETAETHEEVPVGEEEWAGEGDGDAVSGEGDYDHDDGDEEDDDQYPWDDDDDDDEEEESEEDQEVDSPAEYIKLVPMDYGDLRAEFDEWKTMVLPMMGDQSPGEGGSQEEDNEEEQEEEEEEKVEEKPPQKTVMGMKSFRYFESRILANFCNENDDEKMNVLREKLLNMRKVKRPTDSVLVLKEPQMSAKKSRGGEFAWVDDDEEVEGGVDDKPLAEFTPQQWALKNAQQFLQTAGCKSPQPSETALKTPNKDKTTTLKVFLSKGGVGKKRRGGLGSEEDAPEINSALRRLAERAMWRAIINNSKPKYPLPRFILPRHKFLRRVESELIGPGSYEHDYYEMQRQKKLKATPSMFNSCSNRFKKEERRAPASDCLTDPWEKWDAACKRYSRPGKVPLFQSTPCNFRYKDFYVGCGIAPNYYEFKSPLQEFLNKKGSNRGMYETRHSMDSFCLKSKSHDISARLGPGAYEVRGSIVRDLEDRYKYFKGRLSKTDRKKMYGFKAAFEAPLWPTDKGFPGPTTYDPHGIEDWIEPSWAPFGVLAKARKLDVNIQSKMTAPDYYFYGDGYSVDKGWKPEIVGGGFVSDFVSKTPQLTKASKYAALRERNQPTNYHLDQELA